jgi:ABC-type Fe3+-hydroxamate transport system substrate-binding protein
MKFRSIFPYLLATIFLAGWWSLSLFHQPTVPLALRSQTTLSFSRETLLKGLQGDVPAMRVLLIQWRDNATPQESSTYNEAITLADELLSGKNTLHRQEHSITDDTGTTITCPLEGPYLPQTQLAASIMLALSDTTQITALPSAMRSESHLYSEEAMSRIKQDTDRYSSEAIFGSGPRTAFVARYSNPATLETLRNQRLQLIYLDDLSSLETCFSNIQRIGQVTKKAALGQLLAAFTSCALQALDHEIATVRLHKTLPVRALYLDINVHLSTPTKRTLKGLLLERLGYLWPQDSSTPSTWCLPLDQEAIRAYQPEMLLIGAQSSEMMATLLENLPALKSTPACRNGNIFFVDPTTQNCPCQMIALSYYDLCCAILSGQETA